MNLSKSRYTTFRQCPKALWLSVYKPDEGEEPNLATIEEGKIVGQHAKGLFGNYTDVTAYKSDGSLDISKMIEDTKKAMNNPDVETICEAAFSNNGCYCAVDLLHRENGGWAIYEVKSSSHNEQPDKNGKPKKDDISQSYIWDIAYQKHVLTQYGIHVTGTYLVRIESSYVRQKVLDVKQLFHIKDMSELIAPELKKVAEYCEAAKALLAKNAEPKSELHAGCHSPHDCAFKEYCMKLHNVPTPSVFDLYSIGWNKAIEIYKETIGEVDYPSLLKSGKITQARHLRQIDAELKHKDLINKEAIRKWLKENINYPVYHLDFETMKSAIPLFPGTHPFQQIPFQYSLHIEQADGTVEHREYLAQANGENPMRQLAEQLCTDIPTHVRVLAYNKDFEQGRIEEMAKAFPDLHDHLMAIHDNIRDLAVPFQKWYYYRPAMNGSFSIKAVLPALFPNDPKLDYHNLPGLVHHGGEAMAIFPAMLNMTEDEVKAARKSLLEYCWLDTWSMVVILRKLFEVTR